MQPPSTSEFDPQNRNEDVDCYVANLDELVKKFGGIAAEAKTPKQESLALCERSMSRHCLGLEVT